VAVTRRGRISFGAAHALLPLLAGLSACAQTVVLEDQTSDGGPTSLNDGSTSDGRCLGGQGQPLPFKMKTPEVIVALDRSSGMNQPMGGGMTELSAALTTLVPKVQSYQSLIRFGFIDFPDNLDSCPDSCCVSELYTPPPDPGMSNTGPLETAAYACNMSGPGGNGMNNLNCPTDNPRPTEVALEACAAYYQNGPQTSPRYVLLLTNGEPSGSCGGDAKGDCQDSEDQVIALSALNVQTMIVDLGEQQNFGDCLHNLAPQPGAGGETHYYFPGANGLADSLKTIADGIAGDACHLVLTTTPSDPSLVSVSYNFTPIAHDSTNGWSFEKGSPVNIVLNGASCQNLIGNPPRMFGLQIFYGCGSGHGGQSGP
jgi:hypothetical protein